MQIYMPKKILVTLGPSSLSEEIIQRFDAFEVYLFRINLSHTPLDLVAATIDKIQQWTHTPICLDSEGAQLRNQKMINEKTVFTVGDEVKIHFQPVVGDGHNISFSPNKISKQFLLGDVIRVDFDHVQLEISKRYDDYCLATVINGGDVGSNKASDIDRELDFDPLTDKDRAAVAIGLEKGIRNFALSFTNRRKDVEKMRESCGPESNIICKIESRSALENLESILDVADEILIDRGDLSRQVSIEKVPFLQRKVISIARSRNVPVFVATNLLESMIQNKSPNRAEVNDVVSTLLMGADGLVLAAETAIGKHPAGAVKMIDSLIIESAKWTSESSLQEILE